MVLCPRACAARGSSLALGGAMDRGRFWLPGQPTLPHQSFTALFGENNTGEMQTGLNWLDHTDI